MVGWTRWWGCVLISATGGAPIFLIDSELAAWGASNTVNMVGGRNYSKILRYLSGGGGGVGII